MPANSASNAPSGQQGGTPRMVNGDQDGNGQPQGSASNAQQSQPATPAQQSEAYTLALDIQPLMTDSERRALGL
ncbi:hypothetical protein PSPO01_15765 [Paraphaeosphaeria sporulosa]